MPRIPGSPPPPDNTSRYSADAAAQLDSFRLPSKRHKRMTPSKLHTAIDTFARMAADEDYDPTRPGEMVAMYAWLHREVYGAEPRELLGEGWSVACRMAGQLLHGEFDDDAQAMTNYIKWAWVREQRQELWRRQNKREGRRVTWRLQFGTGSGLLTDYQVALQRIRGGS